MPSINVSPNLRLRPTWLVAEIDFPVEMTRQALKDSETGVRTGASRDFEAEMRWAVDKFIEDMEKKGHLFIGPKGGPIVEGPFLPYNYSDHWPRGGDDNEELPRRRERSVEDTGGRVCYRMAAQFLVREHIFRRVVERDKEPEMYAAIKNAKKEDGIWVPHPPRARSLIHVKGDRNDG